MKRVFRYSSLALMVAASIGGTYASMHPESFGVYSTAVQEDRLFIENGTTLRCDLFFSSADHTKLVAPKGSLVAQTVPPFVWQYSGLLPVSDYLKTAVIHSVSSESKERSWQDVQHTFYKGLRAEGARDFEAKVAFAGAYAFAPRWPLVELIDITEPARDKDTRLYQVKYVAAPQKGVSIEEYRTLVNDIVANSDSISLKDIRGVVDAADSVKTAAMKKSQGGWIKRLMGGLQPDAGGKAAKQAMTESKPAGNNLGALFLSEKNLKSEAQKEMVKEIPDETPIKPVKEMVAELESPVEAQELVDPVANLFVDDRQVEKTMDDQHGDQIFKGVESSPVEVKPVADVQKVTNVTEAATNGVPVDIDFVSESMQGTEPKRKIWKLMPDGSLVLENVE